MLIERTLLCEEHKPDDPTPDPATESADSEISFDSILPADPDEEAPELSDINPTLQLENPSTPAVQPLPPQPATQSSDAGPSATQPCDDAGTLPVTSAPLPPSQHIAYCRAADSGQRTLLKPLRPGSVEHTSDVEAKRRATKQSR
jgi:hypothetical protein